MEYKLNTANHDKLQEFQRLFALHGHTLIASTIDLEEIDADLLQIVVHKASQVNEGTLVEDTSLEVDGASIGSQIRWLLNTLQDHLGKEAIWTVLLAYRKGTLVYVYQGVVKGTLVSPRGAEGFGFDNVFLPASASLTLAESKPDSVNARALAVEAFFQNRPLSIEKMIPSWKGKWQNSD